uniref:Putative retrotransposon protein n=1 Tax=Phyllostachys edulis TaxID=38705 RepID=D3IVN4_PHYED|nr:putative retrotransposon protein [Phyllostachys edulis]
MTMRMSIERVREANAQKLRKEFEDIEFNDGNTLEEEKVVKKFLRVVPPRYTQVAISIETLLDLSTLLIEELISRLRSLEKRYMRDDSGGSSGRLLLTEEEWLAHVKKREQGDSSSGGDKCYRGKPRGHGRGTGGYDGKDGGSSNAHRDMSQVCALIEASVGAGTDMVLNEVHPQVHLGHEEDAHDDASYLDTDASNHLSGCQASFAEMNEGITGFVKFNNGSVVDIHGCGTVLFTCRNGEHLVLIGVYYIPRLHSNIVSLRQLDENGYQTLIQDGMLTIRDRQRRILGRVNRTRNRLYVLTLSITQPVCLSVWCGDDAWRLEQRS